MKNRCTDGIEMILRNGKEWQEDISGMSERVVLYRDLSSCERTWKKELEKGAN